MAAKSIAKGLLAGHTKDHPGYWIHTSGTAILCWHDSETKIYGEAPSQTPYDDLEDVARLTSLPDSAYHRDIDKIVLSTGSNNAGVVKTAIVCPPTIYGPGRGPDNTRSKQAYNLAKIILQKGKAPQLGKGLTEWDNVHIHDLSSLFVLLVEEAVSGDKKDIDSELWGEKGYFLAENGHHAWGELSKQIAQAAYNKGFISTQEVQVMSPDEAMETAGFEGMLWGMNSKGFAKRARKFLGWKPVGRSLPDEVPGIVDGEAKSLGLVAGN